MAETHYCKSRWMQEHPWLDRLYVKLALQVKKKKKKGQKEVSNNRTQNGKKNNQGKLGEPTPATCYGGWACRWITELKRNWTSQLSSTLAYMTSKRSKKNLRGKKYGTTNPASTWLEPSCFTLKLFSEVVLGGLDCRCPVLITWTWSLLQKAVPGRFWNADSSKLGTTRSPCTSANMGFQAQVRSFRHHKNLLLTGCWARPWHTRYSCVTDEGLLWD